MTEYQITMIGCQIIKTACQRKMTRYQIIKTAWQSRKIGLKQTRYDGNRSVYNHRQQIIMQSNLMRQFWRSIIQCEQILCYPYALLMSLCWPIQCRTNLMLPVCFLMNPCWPIFSHWPCEPHHEKTCLRDLRPVSTQTGLRKHRN